MAEILNENNENGEDLFIDSAKNLPLTLPLAIVMKSDLLKEKNKDPVLSKKHTFRLVQLS